MTASKSDIFRQLEAVLAEAEPAQIEQLLSDIANGTFCETAQTRAGTNDSQCNVTHMSDSKAARAKQQPNSVKLADETGRQRYSS